MLCGVVVLSNCACIWISCSSRLLLATFERDAVVELPEVLDEPAELVALEEVDEAAGVVIATLEPSA